MKRRLSPLIISKYQVNLYIHHSGISSSGVNIKVETALMLDSTCYLRIKKEQRMLSLFRNTGPTSSLFENYTLQLTEIYRYIQQPPLKTPYRLFKAAFLSIANAG